MSFIKSAFRYVFYKTFFVPIEVFYLRKVYIDPIRDDLVKVFYQVKILQILSKISYFTFASHFEYEGLTLTNTFS